MLPWGCHYRAGRILYPQSARPLFVEGRGMKWLWSNLLNHRGWCALGIGLALSGLSRGCGWQQRGWQPELGVKNGLPKSPQLSPEALKGLRQWEQQKKQDAPPLDGNVVEIPNKGKQSR